MTDPPSRRPRWLVLVAISLVAMNLRIALASLPAVESDIADATGWSGAVIGSLTMLPVLCMGAFALVVPRVARRIGRRQTVGLALALITAALVMRLAGATPGVLHLSALIVGIGIALAAGLVPSVVREQLPSRGGLATGLWTGWAPGSEPSRSGRCPPRSPSWSGTSWRRRAIRSTRTARSPRPAPRCMFATYRGDRVPRGR
ncbi:MAG: hypothetical protein NTX29_12685 [Actinobacteria bacterium]|nr:hypothetical protein [Actinomycetota bacterium]